MADGGPCLCWWPHGVSLHDGHCCFSEAAYVEGEIVITCGPGHEDEGCRRATGDHHEPHFETGGPSHRLHTCVCVCYECTNPEDGTCRCPDCDHWVLDKDVRQDR